MLRIQFVDGGRDAESRVMIECDDKGANNGG